jgi:Ion transport protein
MIKMIVEASPDLETTNLPKSQWRQYVHKFVTGTIFPKATNYFDYFVMACIVSNMFLLSATMDDSSAVYNEVLDKVNYFFSAVFAIECILKLISFGFSYFQNSWNCFDFFVVSASALDIVLATLNTVSLKFLRVGPQLARILRVLRVSRLFRLLNKYKGL